MAKILMIGTDSRNALIAAESDCVNLSTRHTDFRCKWVKEKVWNGELTLQWIETAQMKANGLIKPLNAIKAGSLRLPDQPYQSDRIPKERKEESRNRNRRSHPTGELGQRAKSPDCDQIRTL
jgi:hypothetical protein